MFIVDWWVSVFDGSRLDRLLAVLLYLFIFIGVFASRKAMKMFNRLPTLKLVIESHPVNPPRPISVAVMDGSRTIGIIPIDEFRATVERLKLFDERRAFEEARRLQSLAPGA